jgi:hypothetical protein
VRVPERSLIPWLPRWCLRRRVCRAASIAALAAATVPASASAAKTVYGGEAGPDRAPFALQLDPAYGTGEIAFSFDVSCAPFDSALDISDALSLVSPPMQTSNTLVSAPPSANGSWWAIGDASYRIGAYKLEISETVRGTLTGANANGTFRARARLLSRRPGRRDIKCRPARYRWQARSSPQRIFAGSTSDNRPVVIELTDDGTAIRRARVTGWANCGGRFGAPTESTWRNFPIDSAGDFETSVPYRYRAGRTRFRGRQGIAGNLGANVARGAFSDRWTARYADGTRETCSTGRVRYMARTSPAPPQAG